MTELDKIKKRIIGKWEVMNTPGVLSHYTFTENFEIHYGNMDPAATTTQKKYTVETKGGKIFIKKTKDVVEIGGISKNWMLWIKGKNFFILKKI